MMQYLPILVFGGLILLMISLWLLHLRAERKRVEAWRQAADDMGFEFQASAGTGFLSRYPGFHLFSQGRGRTVRNLLRGEAGGLEVSVFDYSYTTGSGKNQRTWHQTVLAFEIEEVSLPSFSLRPENVFHKIGQWFGYRDINFESHPRFSRSYLLRGENEEAVREVFQDRVLEYYEEISGVCTEGCGGRLVYYRSQKRINPAEVRQLLEEGFEVLALFRPSGKKGTG